MHIALRRNITLIVVGSFPSGYLTRRRQHMCELRSLVHSALEVSSSGEQESFNLFLPPLGRNIKEKHLNLYLNRRKTIGEEKDIIPTHPGIPYNFTDSNPSIPISKPSLSALAARLSTNNIVKTRSRAKQVIAAAKLSKPYF